MTNEQMPAAIAELMGWKWFEDRQCYNDGSLPNGSYGFLFHPITDRNHSRLAVERCAKLGWMQRYSYYLATEVGQIGSDPSIVALILATPAQETRAAYRTLFEHQTTEGDQQ